MWDDIFNVELKMWNVALSGLVYLPLDGPVEPFAYAGAGRSYWTIDALLLSGLPTESRYKESSSDFYWHMGFGAEASVGENLKLRIGYRYWVARIDAGSWGASPNYRYRRRALDVSVHWAFGTGGTRPAFAEQSGRRPAANSGRWYLGGGLHGLLSEREDNRVTSTALDFFGPRVYGGYRFNDWFALEAEAGKSGFRGQLWTTLFDVKLDMWNVALSGLIYMPLGGLVEPFVYAGAGRSYWSIEAEFLRDNPAHRISRKTSSNFYWHLGLGAEARVSDNLKIRIGYRYWVVKLDPPENWPHTPDYRYRRGSLEATVHWAF